MGSVLGRGVIVLGRGGFGLRPWGFWSQAMGVLSQAVGCCPSPWGCCPSPWYSLFGSNTLFCKANSSLLTHVIDTSYMPICEELPRQYGK